MLCDGEEILADMPGEVVGQEELIPDPGDRVPFDDIKRVRPDVINERCEELPIVAEQGQAGMRRHDGADLLPERAPPVQPVQRIVSGRYCDPGRGERIAHAEQSDRTGDIDRDCGAQSAPPLPPERPGDHKYGRGNIGRRRPVGLGPRQQADSEHHCERRQGEGSEQAGAALGETAGAGSDREQRGKAQRAEYGELRGEEFEKSAGMEQHAADLGIVADMAIADKIVMPVPPQVRQVQ